MKIKTSQTYPGYWVAVDDDTSFAPPSESKPLPPVEPKASVSAAEFLAQAQRQHAERQGKAKAPIEPKAPKKSKLFTTLALCVTFALGAAAGSIGGCAAANRYQFVPRSNVRIDKLTGKTWVMGRSSYGQPLTMVLVEDRK